MKIELYKDVNVYLMDFVGEVDFFDLKSPYIKLLENIKTKDDLMNELVDRHMPDAAIKNIINRLEELKVLKDGYFENVEDGFPEKEYGKYSLKVYENEMKLPFKYKNKDIKREKAVSKNFADDIKQDTNFIKMVQDSNNKFKIVNIENDIACLKSIGLSELKIEYKDAQWKYYLDSLSFPMEDMNFNDIFRGEWDHEYESLKIGFSLIKDHSDFIESFEYSYIDEIEINNYGKLRGILQAIPVIPKTLEDAKEWFIYLLKRDIEKMNRFISKEELKQLWLNLMGKIPKFKKFELKFDFEMILKEFGKESKFYWLLQASIDLYPFDNTLVPKDRVIIDAKQNIDLIEDMFNHFHINKPSELIIVDRWIVNYEQYKGLEQIIKAFGCPKTTIITQKVKDRKNNEAIDEIINNNKITLVEKLKSDIVHQRYWIFDNKSFYQTSESLDFIKVEKNQINVSHATFELYDVNDLDPKLLNIRL